MNAERQVKIIGVVAILLGVYNIFMALTMLLTMAASSDIKSYMLLVLAFLFLLNICFYIVGGIGLLKHKKWARFLLVALSFLSIAGLIIGVTSFLSEGNSILNLLEISKSNIIYVYIFLWIIQPIWFLIILFNKDVRDLVK